MKPLKYNLQQYKDYADIPEDVLFNGDDVIITEGITGIVFGIKCNKRSKWKADYFDDKFEIFSSDSSVDLDNYSLLVEMLLDDMQHMKALDDFANAHNYENNYYLFVEFMGKCRDPKLVDLAAEIKVGKKTIFHCLDHLHFMVMSKESRLDPLPILYTGKFKHELIEKYKNKNGIIIRSTNIRGNNMEMCGGFIGLKA